MGRPYVSVIGPGECDEALGRQAEELGRRLAEAGVVVVCGGRGGAMEAVCRGVRAGGGVSLGILPGDSRDDANPFVDLALPTGLGEARNTLVVRAGDVVIAVGGGFGTLSELGFALKLGRPVIGLGTWELGQGGVAVEAVERAGNPEDAVTRALAKLRG